jgi:hypothetical protein
MSPACHLTNLDIRMPDLSHLMPSCCFAYLDFAYLPYPSRSFIGFSCLSRSDPAVFLLWITRCFLIWGTWSLGPFAYPDNLTVFLIRATRPSGSLAYPDNLAVFLIRATRFSDNLALPGLPDSRVILLIRATRSSNYLALPRLPDSQVILIIRAT